MSFENIAALSTPPGEGGIAIIRASGEQIIDKVKDIFKPFRPGVKLQDKPGYSLTLGWILNEREEIIDEVLVAIMRAPHSYTGEEVVEINCHGGTLAARRCLQELIKQGFRLAEPGEFTRRAFLNGRLDVSQAEAVIDIIRAKTDKGLQLAQRQLAGSHKKRLVFLEEQLTGLSARLEASMDFPEEVGEIDYPREEAALKSVLECLNRWIEAAQRLEIYREGINIAICGKPNVGKSSLLNYLLQKDKAIVTDIPGTTRDVIEDFINIKGIPVKLSDTAGIRFTQDVVEKIGIEKSEGVIRGADLVIFILDAGCGVTEEDQDIYKKIARQNVIVLVNKDDLKEKKLSKKEISHFCPESEMVWVSVKQHTGMRELEEAIEARVLSGALENDDLAMSLNLRQKQALLKARSHIEDALKAWGQVPLDCLGIDIWGAAQALEEISGKNLKEDVLERIFHDFCIGK